MADEKKQGVAVSVRLEKTSVECLDLMAEKIDVTRSKMAANLVAGSLPELQFFSSLGLLAIAKWYQDILEKIGLSRKKATPTRITVGIWLDQDLVERIDLIAKKVGLTRSKLTANIIESGIPELKFFEKIGAVDVVMFIEDLKNRQIKKWKELRSKNNRS